MSSAFLNALAGTRLYPLTDRLLSGLTQAEQVAQLRKGGATIVQLREKLLSPVDFYRESIEALRVARDSRVKIIINDHVDVALALGADGVHLGQDDMPPEAARELLGPDVIIGLSTHNLEQVLRATKMPIDYIAIGPIFSTDTKDSSEPAVGLLRLAEVRQVVGEIPLVAIGGITSENSQDVLSAGADAIAVIKDIWISSSDIPAQVERLLNRMDLTDFQM